MQRMLAGLIVAGLSCGTAAQEDSPARMRLVSELNALTPGKTAWLGVSFEIEPEWHLYWNGQSDSGAPPEVKISVPEGFKTGPLVWPAPRRHVSPGDLLDHVYENRVTLMLPVEAPASAKPGSTAHFSADGSWMVCRTVCLLGRGEAGLDIPIAEAGKEPKPSRDAAVFAEARARVPKPLPATDSPVSLTWQDGKLRINAEGASWVAFYPGPNCAPLVDLIRNGEAKGATLTLEPEKPGRVEGVLEVRQQSGKGTIVYQIDSSPPNPAPSQPSNQPTPHGG
jgi:thiol:disulfide interchange protein DsbD